MMSLAGRVAIVTASTAGIGLAIARKLGEQGAAVVVSSRKEKNVKQTVDALKQSGLTVEGIPCHVAKEQDRQNLVNFALERFGKIDILINNAGMNPHFGSLLEVSEEVWDKIFDTNVKAGFLLTKLVVPHMEKLGGGSIVFVSSITGYLPSPGIMAYGISKTAIFGLTKALASTLATQRIRVNCIAPGIIKTDFSKALWEGGEESPAKGFLDSMIPMQRLGTPQECAGIVAFLCTDEASYITGETVNVTGGMPGKL